MVITSKTVCAADLACDAAVYSKALTDIWVVPTKTLDIAFALGWSKLAKELKIQIIGHNLAYSQTVQHSIRPKDLI